VNLRRLGRAKFYRRSVDRLNSATTSVKNLALVLTLVAGIYFGITGLPLLVYGQTSSGKASINGDLKKQTSGGALGVVIQPSPQPIGHTGSTSLKVQFLTKETDKVQPHIDYEITIKDSSGREVFAASQLAGQPPPLHTSEGVVTIPYTFQGPGDYTIDVTVYGILFNPIKPESADFTIKVT
jgi:hypothetical protein